MTDAADIFKQSYWDRPAPRDQGDQGPERIYRAVGYGLSQWELADQALANLFIQFAFPADNGSSLSYDVTRRAYGSFFGNAGRRGAIDVAAEVFFENHWENRVVRQWIKDIINAFQWGSILRDDIAHGVARAHRITITGNTYDFGTFHLPPDYNTGRTNLRGDGGGTSAPHTTARYRYVGEDIENIAHRFNVLRDVTQDRASTIYRVFDDGGGVSDLVKVIVDGQGEKR